MPEFQNVTIVKQANIYFGGNVVSRTIKFADGTIKTLGFMQQGEYTFNTSEKELMEIITGVLEVLLPESEQWQTIKTGESFNVPANSKFTVRILSPTDYCCTMIA